MRFARSRHRRAAESQSAPLQMLPFHVFFAYQVPRPNIGVILHAEEGGTENARGPLGDGQVSPGRRPQK